MTGESYGFLAEAADFCRAVFNSPKWGAPSGCYSGAADLRAGRVSIFIHQSNFIPILYCTEKSIGAWTSGPRTIFVYSNVVVCCSSALYFRVPLIGQPLSGFSLSGLYLLVSTPWMSYKYMDMHENVRICVDMHEEVKSWSAKSTRENLLYS